MSKVTTEQIKYLRESAHAFLKNVSPDDNLGYRKDLKDAKLYNVTVSNMAYFALFNSPPRKPLSEVINNDSDCNKLHKIISYVFGGTGFLSPEKFKEAMGDKDLIAELGEAFKMVDAIRSLGYDVINPTDGK